MTAPTLRALDKALGLLIRLAADDGARGVSALAREAGLPAPTAHRMVATLERRGFILRIARGRYLVGPALVRITQGATMNRLLTAAGRPIVEALAKETGRTAHLGVFEGDMVTYLIKAGRAGDGLFTREGMQLEAYCSGIGKMLLALLPDDQRERYLASGPFIALTDNTITEPDRLRLALRAIRVEGIARDEREIASDLRCTAAPVLDGVGEAVAAISISSRSGQGDPASHEDALRAAARKLSMRLFPKTEVPETESLPPAPMRGSA